jgi:orotidine-5'-phosphate decarboxylase
MLNGADFIVVGRPIRQAGNAAQQVAAARRVVEEIEQGLQDRGR